MKIKKIKTIRVNGIECPPRDMSGWRRIIEKDGSTYTFYNGLLESYNDEPAIVRDGVSRWFHKGNLHRINNPAVVSDQNTCEYWYEHTKLTEAEYCKKMVETKLANEEYRKKHLLLAL